MTACLYLCMCTQYQSAIIQIYMSMFVCLLGCVCNAVYSISIRFHIVYIYIYIYIERERERDRSMKGCILPFSKNGDLGLAMNYRGITLTSIAAKIYNALLLHFC